MTHASSAARSPGEIRSVRLQTLRDDIARILVVHSPADAETASSVVRAMHDAGHDAGRCEISRFVVDGIVNDDPDLVLLIRASDSFNLPHLCAELNEAVLCRTIVLDYETGADRSAATEQDAGTIETREVEALEAGADDYLSGHGSGALLLARVRVALRARPARRRRAPLIEIGDIVIDVQAHSVLIAGVAVDCRPLQFKILIALATRADELVTRESLIAGVWGVQPGSIDVSRVRIAISVLRRIIGSGPRRPTIESVSGLGYRLTVAAAPGS